MFTRASLMSVVALWAVALSLLSALAGYGQAQNCSVSKLTLQFTTGSDDLRGGENNLDVQIHFADGPMQVIKNVNNGQTWAGHSFRTVSILLKQPVAAAQITQITLIHNASAGIHFNGTAPPFPILPKSEDNWDMAQMKAIAVGTGTAVIASAGPYRFTGSAPSLSVAVTPPASCEAGDITQLRLTFFTGSDDLRGGNDNLNVIVHYRDGSPDQFEGNVNHNGGWGNNSRHDVSVFLSRTSAVDSITLQTTFTGGTNGDNWNMDSLEIAGFGIGVHQNLATAGFHRFTGPPGNSLTVPITGWPAPPPVSGGPSHCRPDDTSEYCRLAHMGRKPAPPKSGALFSSGSHGLAPQPAGNAGGLLQSKNAISGSAPARIALSSQPHGMLPSVQAAPPGSTSPARAGLLAAPVAAQQKVVTNADVILQVKSRKPEPEIISSINSAQHKFDFSPAGCRSLAQARVSQNILRAMGDGSVMPCAAGTTRFTGVRRSVTQ